KKYEDNPEMCQKMLQVIEDEIAAKKEKNFQARKLYNIKMKEQLEQKKEKIRQEYANDDNMRTTLLDAIESDEAKKRAKRAEANRASKLKKKAAQNQQEITNKNPVNISQAKENSTVISNDIFAAENNVPEFPKLNKIRFELTFFGNSKNSGANKEVESNSFSSSPRLDQ
ncbi:MAG: hypothetical protein JO149_03640, partial [Gammaproteobacteria bacterium]|nr:hypothetical protein [Gammaproteobacteria bacterium]